MSADKLPAVELAVRTDPGRDPDKQVNEDSSVEKETAFGLLAVVCDGMGGHAGGKEASELAIATIVEIIDAAPPMTSPGAALKRAIEEANARIWSMPTAEAGYRPGSTVVAVLAHDEGVEVAHVGDSRLYLLHGGVISQVTRDHSMVQEMVDRNLIRAEDAASHPDANKILRALGVAKEVEVELRSEPLPYVAGDVLVLCSDGLSDLVEPAEMLRIAGSHPASQAASQLVDLANARGGHDNITAMVLRFKSGAASREAAPVLKTVVQTAPGAFPPVATVVAAPLSSSPVVTATLPMQPSSSGPSAAVPPAPSSPEPSNSRERSGAVSGDRRRSPNPIAVVLGILLAVVAVAIVGAIVFVATRPRHKTVTVVDDRPQEAPAPTPSNGDTTGEPDPPVVAPAPPLDPTPLVHHGRRDGGVFDPCAVLRRARERDASAAVVGHLEERCRARGGTP